MDTNRMNTHPRNPGSQPNTETAHPDSCSHGMEHTQLSVSHPALNGTRLVAWTSLHAKKQRVTISLPTSPIERLRNAVYGTGHRPLVALVSEAIEDILAQMEEGNGGAFPQRVAPLKGGRRQGPRPPFPPATAHSPESAYPHRSS